MDKILSRIQRLWYGKTTQEEADVLQRLLQERNKDLEDELKAGFYRQLEQEQPAPTERTKDILVRLMLRIDQQAQRQEEQRTVQAPWESKKARVISLRRKSIGWAAASVLVAVAGWQLFHYGTKNPPVSHMERVVAKNDDHLHTITNNTTIDKVITLVDGSNVTLYPKSTLSWSSTFDAHARDLRLNGKALFNVAKQENKPFTVYAAGIAATALGTQFTVNVLTGSEVEVKLLEGKVVVKLVQKSSFAMRDVYLLPGQLVKIDTAARTFAVRAFQYDNATAAHKQPAVRSTEDNIALSFEHAPLALVFEKLSSRYHTHINFTRDQLEGLYFSGSLLKSDSLTTLLNILSNMNGLKYEKIAGSIFIKK